MTIKFVLMLAMLCMSILGMRAVIKGKDETIYNAILMALLYLKSDSIFVEMLALIKRLSILIVFFGFIFYFVKNYNFIHLYDIIKKPIKSGRYI